MHHKSGQACVTNWGSFVLLKLGQTLLQIGAAPLLHIRTSVVTNRGSYYKLGQPLLQNRAAIQIGAKCITNWGRYYNLYTLEHFL